MTTYTENQFNYYYNNFLDKILSNKIKPLIVYSQWRGMLDTLQSFVDSLSSFNIYPLCVDWSKDKWILSNNSGSIVDFHQINKIARSFDCDLVILLGANLRFNQPIPDKDNSNITYVAYHISPINRIQDDTVTNFTYNHYAYLALSFCMDLVPKAKWLPTSINFDQYSLYLKKYQHIKPNENLLLTFNKSEYKTDYRLQILQELIGSNIPTRAYGSLVNKPINSFDLLEEIVCSKLILDDNRDGLSFNYHFNDRFSMCSILRRPVLTNKCKDLDICFDNQYLFLNYELSLIDNINHIYSLPQDYLDNIVNHNYKCMSQRHRNEFRWANIFYDHLNRINKI